MSNTANFPLLSLIMFTPLVGALLLLFVSKQNAIRWIANVFAVVGFLVSLPLWFWLDKTSPDWQFFERYEWIPSIGAEYFIGVDGFQLAADPAGHADGRDRGTLVLDRDHGAA